METRLLHNSTETGVSVVQVEQLFPYFVYQVQLVAENSAGSLTGNPFPVQTAPAAPEGFEDPGVSLLEATTLLVEWDPPAIPGGNITSYMVTVRRTNGNVVMQIGVQPLINNSTQSAVVSGLMPFTNYSVSVTVVNEVDSTDSGMVEISTGQTAPVDIDTVQVIERGPRSVLLSWDPPAFLNGILTNYTLRQDGNPIASLPPDVLSYNATSLLPFTAYNFSVMACNVAGCETSPPASVQTLEDAPEGVSEPFVTAVGSSVVVTWNEPSMPNGIILHYLVQRADTGSDAGFATLGTVLGDAALVLVDTTTLPFRSYDYRIVAVNSAGSMTGPATMFLTDEEAPMNISTPTLEVLSSTAINVTFEPPGQPNGILVQYVLVREQVDGGGSSIATLDFNASSLLFVNGSYTYPDTGLLPYTTYSYTLTVCTSAGCTTAQGVPTAQTDEDTPAGLAPPTAATLSSTSLIVEWDPPSHPNGVILSYQVVRNDVGFFDNSTGAMSVPFPDCCQQIVEENMTMAEIGSGEMFSSDCSIVDVTSGVEATNLTDMALTPYSLYRYCVVAENSVGMTYSQFSPVTPTLSAPMPTAGPTLTAFTLNSTAIQLSWTSVDVAELLGPFNGYTLYGKVAGSLGVGAELFSGEEQDFTVTDLIASTEYVFVVSVSNGEGSTFGNNVTTITDEGIPANLSAPDVIAITGTFLSVSWKEPQQPNGVIVNYTIYLDGMPIHNQSDPGTLVISDLKPFTYYSVQVEACTQFGCVLSPLVIRRTLETPPLGLASPVVTVLGPTSVNVTWSEPTQPNGEILSYQLFQRRKTSDCETCYEVELIFSGIAFQYVASGLTPFTTYGFSVVAVNSAGNVTSGITTITTEQAPPTSVDAPTVLVLSSTSISVTWSEPAEVNGVLLNYTVYRNGGLLASTNLLSLVDGVGLKPFTQYSYVIEACTQAGCTNSSSVANTTLEDIPVGVSSPVVTELQARSMLVSWEPPTAPNGIITVYVLTLLGTVNDTELFRGLDLSLAVDGLLPFTSYSLVLTVCNSVGCTSSNVTEVKTLQAPPDSIDAPMVRSLNSTSVAISWTAPEMPNGIVTSYVLRRASNATNAMVVFEGLGFSFNDVDLVPNTLYHYTVEVVNGGGSTLSDATFINTSPDLAEGQGPPALVVLGPTEIQVIWSPPLKPNGDISTYLLFLNNEEVFSGIGFEYLATGLTPFTVYSFYVEVCNQAGCASSITVFNTTDEAKPEDVVAPTLVALSSTAVEVSWVPPGKPNGIITAYEVRRRNFGEPLTEMVHYPSGPPSVLSFINSVLTPFTKYEYRLRVFNSAGSTFSDWVSIQTPEDVPQGVGLPMFANGDINARNVTATWSPPEMPNGIITSYELHYRLAFVSMLNGPGEPVLGAVVPGNITAATVTGLLPASIYEFRLVAVNSVAEGESEWFLIVTAEDKPEDIQPIIVEERTGSTLTLSWEEPATPNGVITEYMLFLDGELVYSDAASMYEVQRLDPYTTYSLQLAACTSAGCSFANPQLVTTAEVIPFGQPAPNLLALSPRVVEVTWDPPLQPNGIITSYQVLRQESSPSSLKVINTTTDVLTRLYVDEDIVPASSYQYAIRAINSQGQTESEFKDITTPATAPEGLSAPTLIALSPTEIQVSWAEPLQPNGIITQYQALRSGGGMVNVSVHVGQNRAFVDDLNLKPYTQYTYVIEACTFNGGCSVSMSSSVTTLESVPEGFDPPMLEALSSTMISIEWDEPESPNGIITSYMVNIEPVSIQITTVELSVNISNLLPFTVYTVSISACTAVGCTPMESETVRTLEALPQFISPPSVTVLGPTSVQATWQQPAKPNGIITLYELRRNDSIVFNGTGLVYIDENLLPDTLYQYDVQAYTSVGGGERSGPRFVTTHADTPEDVGTPVLTVISATAIEAQWTMPGQPNGVISLYILTVNGSEVYRGLEMVFTVTELSPYTSYSFAVTACTTTCATGDDATARTAEAIPEGQAPPTLTAHPNLSVEITWEAPSSPNGVILFYSVQRRLLGTTVQASVFTGLLTNYLDDDADLRATLSYEYRVVVTNGAGSLASDWRNITLPEAAPEGVPPPEVITTASNSITLLSRPPATPNGIILRYVLYRNSNVSQTKDPIASEDAGPTFIEENLTPFTEYSFHVAACTAAGCGNSPMVVIYTDEAPPMGFDVVVPTAASLQTEVGLNITWPPPSVPNGIITGYRLWYQRSCPQPPQPRLSNLPPCVLGNLTMIDKAIPGNQLYHVFTESHTGDPFPYIAYRFQVVAMNSVGSATSGFSLAAATITSVPEVFSGFVVFLASNGIVSLDWSTAFRYNGPVLHFVVSRNGTNLFQIQETQITLENEPRGVVLNYVITLVTEVGQVSTEVYQLMLPVEPTETPTIAMTTPEPTNQPFYDQPAFIVGMIILGLVLLFPLCIVLLCCFRPRGDTDLKTLPRVNLSRAPTRKGYEQMPNDGFVRASWTPGEPTNELPESPVATFPVTSPAGRSYSPQKAASTALQMSPVTTPSARESFFEDTRVPGPVSSMSPGTRESFFPDSRVDASPAKYSATRESFFADTHISTSKRSPLDKYHILASEDFGSFKKPQQQEHTTFTDTKV